MKTRAGGGFQCVCICGRVRLCVCVCVCLKACGERRGKRSFDFQVYSKPIGNTLLLNEVCLGGLWLLKEEKL